MPSRTHHPRSFWACALASAALLAAACGDSEGPADTGTQPAPDATQGADAALPADAGLPGDSGLPADTGLPQDLGVPTDTGVESDAGIPTGCGDGVASATEDCDGTDLREASCEDFGYASGSLSCQPSCSYDLSACVPPAGCGDGVPDLEVEYCDDGNNTNGDGCSGACVNEWPYNCSGQPSTCALPSTLGPLGIGDTIIEDGGPLPAGGYMIYLLEIEEALLLSGSVTSTGGDMDFYLVNASGTQVIFDSADDGEERWADLELPAGSYGLFLEAYFDGGAVAAYTLTLRGTTAICGNGAREGQETCDDGNQTPGDGCDANCQWEIPNEWSCDAEFYGARDGCDCGCGAQDPDCADATLAACEFCIACSDSDTSDCSFWVDPNDTSSCVDPVPTEWSCERYYYGDFECDCGCGAQDADCADLLASSCEFCDVCPGQGACESRVEAENNAICLP